MLSLTSFAFSNINTDIEIAILSIFTVIAYIFL